MKLLDQMRRSDYIHKPRIVAPEYVEDWQKSARQLRPFIDDPQLTAILIDNVADYYFIGTDQEEWDLAEHFPNLAPPFEVFWMEHRLPRKIRSEVGDSDLSFIRGRMGCLIFGIPRENAIGEEVPENVKWILSIELFIDYGLRHDGIVEGPHGTIWIGVDEHGLIVDKPWMRCYAREEERVIAQAMAAWAKPCLLAICFLHCKNVVVEAEPIHPKHAKEVRKRHGRDPAKFKRLIIEPLKAILRREGHSDTKGAQHAMHICRGHFKDYREGRGLFGKYKQLVWFPMQVRGTKGDKPAPREMEVKV